MNGELCHSDLLFPMPSPQHQDCLENHFPSYSSCANSNTETITGSRTGLALRRSPFPREQRWPDQRHPETPFSGSSSFDSGLCEDTVHSSSVKNQSETGVQHHGCLKEHYRLGMNKLIKNCDGKMGVKRCSQVTLKS